MKASGLGTFVSDLREKPESTDHMEWLQGEVRAEGRQKWQPLIFVPWSLGIYIYLSKEASTCSYEKLLLSV